MIKILLVDDDDYKISNIVRQLSERKEYDIVIEKAINPALDRLLSERFEMIILDMSIPTFGVTESENFDSFGGVSILKEMRRTKNETPVIIVTQYEIFGEGSFIKTSEDIDEECREKFDNYMGMIIYSSTKDEWKKELIEVMENCR